MRIEITSLQDYLFPATPKQENIVAAIVNPLRWPRRSPNLNEFLAKNNPDWVLVCKKNVPQELHDVMPYLVRLRKNNELTRQILEQIPTEGVILLKASLHTNLEIIAGHLCTLSDMTLPDNTNVWLRYYEPYVLNCIIAMADNEQRAAIFGSAITEFILPDIYDSLINLEVYVPPEKMTLKKETKLLLHPWQIEKLYEAEHEQFLKKTASAIISDENSLFYKTELKVIMQKTGEVKLFAEDNGIVQYEIVRDTIMLASEFGWGWHLFPAVTGIIKGATGQKNKYDALRAYLFSRNQGSVR